jgi:WD40 repeat protein
MRTYKAELTDDSEYLVTATAHPESGQGALTVWKFTAEDSKSAGTQFKAEQLKSFAGHIRDFALAPNSQYLAFVDANGWGGEKTLYQRTLTGSEEPRLLAYDVFGSSHKVEFTPDSRQILIVDANRFAVSYDVKSAQKRTLFSVLRKGGSAEQKKWDAKQKLSPDGTKLAVKYDRGVELWDFKTGQMLYSLPNQEASLVEYITWSSDGQRLAVSRSDGNINIWNIAEIERVLTDLKLWPPVNNITPE